MQAALALPIPAADCSKTDRDLITHLEKSEIYRTYQRAFEMTTGLPLSLRPAGSFHGPLHGSKHANPFCALLAARSKSCSACLQLQDAMEKDPQGDYCTRECFAGLSESSIPIRLGERIVAFLQTGQILRQNPSEAQFGRTMRQLRELGSDYDEKRLKVAYFQTRIVTRAHYDSVLRLLSIFARHLSELSNQLMVQESAAEAPVVARARAFITEHQGEQLSLSQVAQAVNMSSFYFCKVFKRETGLTFTEFLARMRVEAVKKLLLNPHKRVSEAAYEAGFQSLSQFNRVFRRIVGDAPSDYRDKLHGAEAAPRAGLPLRLVLAN